MKIKLFAIVAGLAVLSGCQNQELSKPQTEVDDAHYENIINELNSQATNTFKYARTIKPLTVTRLDSQRGVGKLEIDKILKGTGEYLNDHYYLNDQLTNYEFLVDQNISLVSNKNARTQEEIVSNAFDGVQTFTDLQKDFMTTLTTDISQLDDINDAVDIISTFNQKVIKTEQFTEEQRIQLLSFSALAGSFVTFVNDDFGGIYEELSGEIGGSTSSSNSQRVAACSVNWRGVFLGGVVSFAVGAYAGGKAGLVAGTFTLPGVGTVTGAVAGAMLGGAGGFTGAVITGVAAELLGSCFRNAKGLEVSCQQTFDRFLQGEITSAQIPRACTDNLEINFGFDR